MSEIPRILDQLDRAWNTGAWHGLALRELVDDVTATEAAAKPPKVTHSIWELLHHITAWIEVPTSRLAGVAVNVTAEMNWKPVPEPTREAWDEAREEAQRAYAMFRVSVAAIPEDRLDEVWGPNGSRRYLLVHGVIQHIAYHGGQISLVKKMLRAG